MQRHAAHLKLSTVLYFGICIAKEIHGELADVYGSSVPSCAQVKFWVGGIQTR